MKIEMGKKYRTGAGLPVRIIAVDRKFPKEAAPLPVIGLVLNDDGSEIVTFYTVDGKHASSKEDYHLVEVFSLDDFKEDEPVIATVTGMVPFRAYFAKVVTVPEGVSYPAVFTDGCTSWSGDGSVLIVHDVRRPTEEELHEPMFIDVELRLENDLMDSVSNMAELKGITTEDFVIQSLEAFLRDQKS